MSVWPADCFNSQCWNDYLADCCGCCCECNSRLVLINLSPCGSTSGTIHYEINSDPPATTTDAVAQFFTDDFSVCAWFEPGDPVDPATETLQCASYPCGTVTHDAAVCEVYTADTISFGTTCDAGGSCLCDSANGFVAAGFLVGMRLCVQDSTSNDGDYEFCRISSVTAGKICIALIPATTHFGCFFIDEAAGAMITLTGVMPDIQITDICFSACSSLPAAATVTLDLDVTVTGSCTSNGGAACFDFCECFVATSVKLGTCAGSTCPTSSGELLTDPVELCDKTFTSASLISGLTVSPIIVAAGFCVRIVTEWCNCNNGCTANFDAQPPFTTGAVIEYTGGSSTASRGDVIINFLSSVSGSPVANPCEITVCTEPAGAGTCVTLNYSDTTESKVLSEIEMSPTCYYVTCGGSATPLAPMFRTIGNKLIVDENRYINAVKAQRIKKKIYETINGQIRKRAIIALRKEKKENPANVFAVASSKMKFIKNKRTKLL